MKGAARLEEQVRVILSTPTPSQLPLIDWHEAEREAQSIEPESVADFCTRYDLPLARVAELAGTSRANLYLWAKGSGAGHKTLKRVRTALSVALDEQRRAVRLRELLNVPDVARDLRQVCELAVSTGALSERRAAAILGLDFEMWNALPDFTPGTATEAGE